MKKVLLVLLLVFTFTLTGCDQVEETVTDLQTKLTDVTTDLSDATSTITDLQTTLTTANETITSLETSIEEADAALEASNARIAELEAQSALTNTKIKNALNRDSWLTRKTRYNADWSSYEAEYCFGVFNEDWSTIVANDYTHNTGLKFVITIEQVLFGTEVYVKDSCGNYSEFIFDDSSYGLYSTPANFFEAGATYEVVLYKETYFMTPQLGLLPLVDMADFGQYPTDLSGIVSTKQEQ